MSLQIATFGLIPFAVREMLYSWWVHMSWAGRIVLAISGALAVLAAGWKPVISLWRWGRKTWDLKVLSVLQDGERSAWMANPNRTIILEPFLFDAIAAEFKRSKASVYRTLRRLEKQGDVYEVSPGKWLLGSRSGSNGPSTFSPRLSERFTPRAWSASWEDL
jgi:hypothetical protein